MTSRMPRIAVIGCGAVTELRHLPTLAALGIKPALLIDTNLQRARDLAAGFGVSGVSDDYGAAVKVDAAIVALPHYLHARVSVDLLRSGVHVLVEKPMALSGAECNEMIMAATVGRAILAVGLMRRFLHGVRWTKATLASGLLGAIRSFDVREGSVLKWPMTSGSVLQKQSAGGGVLVDTGAHTLDLLLWWLGDVVACEYYDDSYGGVETDCRLILKMASGAEGTVELSRARNLRGTAVLRGERGMVEIGLTTNRVMSDQKAVLEYSNGCGKGHELPSQTFHDLFRLQLRDWLRAIETGDSPRVSGVEGARGIVLIEACYQQRHLLELPWVKPDSDSAAEVGRSLEW